MRRSRLFHDFADYDDYLARNVMAQLLANVVGPAALPDLIRSASKTPDATSEQMAPMIEVIRSLLFKNRKKAASFVDALLAVPHPDMQDLGEYIAHRFGLRGQRAAARNRPRRALRPRAAG